MDVQTVEALLKQCELLLAQGEARQASVLLDKVLRLDFVNARAWQMLHGMLGQGRPLEVFQREFAHKYYPTRAYLLEPLDLIPQAPPEVVPVKPLVGVGGTSCLYCGRVNPPGQEVCLMCGAGLVAVVTGLQLEVEKIAPQCPQCGYRNVSQARFCGHCGGKLMESDAKVPAPQQTSPQERQPALDPPAHAAMPDSPPTPPPHAPPPQVVIMQGHEPALNPPSQVLVVPAVPATEHGKRGETGMTCPKCGRSNMRDARLCAYCGYDFFYKRVVTNDKVVRERPVFRFHFVDIGDLIVVLSLFLPWDSAEGFLRIPYLLNVWGVIARHDYGAWIIAFIALSLGASILVRARHRLLAILSAIGAVISLIVAASEMGSSEVGVPVAFVGALLVFFGVIFFENGKLKEYIKRHKGLIALVVIGSLITAGTILILPQEIRSAQRRAEESATRTMVAHTTIPLTQVAVNQTEAAFAQTPQAGAELQNHRLAFIEVSNGSLGSIYTINGDGSGLKQIVDSRSTTDLKLVSDGKLLSFKGYVDDVYGAWVVNVAGGNPRLLFEIVNSDAVEWSPDGRKLAFSKDGGVWVVDADGSNLQKLADGHFWKWSEDSRRLAFTRHNPETKASEVYTINFDGSELVNVTGTEDFFPSNHSWSVYPDKCPSSSRNKCLFIRTPDGYTSSFVQMEPGSFFRTAYSPDDQFFAFEWSYSNSNRSDICSVQFSPLVFTQLTYSGNAYFPSWSKDGKWLVYGSNSQMYVVSPGNEPLWIRTNLQVHQPIFLQ